VIILVKKKAVEGMIFATNLNGSVPMSGPSAIHPEPFTSFVYMGSPYPKKNSFIDNTRFNRIFLFDTINKIHDGDQSDENN